MIGSLVSVSLLVTSALATSIRTPNGIELHSYTAHGAIVNTDPPAGYPNGPGVNAYTPHLPKIDDTPVAGNPNGPGVPEYKPPKEKKKKQHKKKKKVRLVIHPCSWLIWYCLE